MADGDRIPIYQAWDTAWKGGRCPECGAEAPTHGWLYTERDERGVPILKKEFYEHADRSACEIAYRDGQKEVLCRRPDGSFEGGPNG